MHEGHLPTPADEHGDAHHDGHRHPHARRHQGGHPEGQAERVSSVEATLVVGEQQVGQAVGERAGERHLERPHDVLAARPEQHHHRRGGAGEPGVDARADHHQPQEHGGREVQGHHRGLVGQVGGHAEELPEHPVDEPGHRHPVGPAVGRDQVGVAALAVGQEHEVVPHEPVVRAVVEQDQRRGHGHVGAEDPRCEVVVAAGGVGPGAVVGAVGGGLDGLLHGLDGVHRGAGHPTRRRYPLGLKVSEYFSMAGSETKSPWRVRICLTASAGPGPKPVHTGWPLTTVSVTTT